MIYQKRPCVPEALQYANATLVNIHYIAEVLIYDKGIQNKTGFTIVMWNDFHIKLNFMFQNDIPLKSFKYIYIYVDYMHICTILYPSPMAADPTAT